MPLSQVIAADIEGLLGRTGPLWSELRGGRVFITGGTGFFGAWLLDALVAANRRFSLGCRVTVLSRDPDRFAAREALLAADPAVTMLAGDVRDFSFPEGPVTHVIHAAAEASGTAVESDPLVMLDVCVEGTRRVLALAAEKRAARFLLTSSGAVYGRQPPELSHVAEGYSGGPDPLDSRGGYAEGKRAAEMLCAMAARNGVPGVSIARCFAFVGPRLPLDAQFAVGNFIRDALGGGPIQVAGDGTPYRSYLYAADLVEWLVTILLRAAPARAYNVGSEEAVSIRDLADRVADVAANVLPTRFRPEVCVVGRASPGAAAARYVPSCARARAELGLSPVTSLSESIRRTLVAAIEASRP